MNRLNVDKTYTDFVTRFKQRNAHVRLPGLKRRDGTYTVGGLMLVFFASRLGRVASKSELVEFLKKMRCNTTDPQPRHLGMQNGLNFIVQGCYHPKLRRVLRQGEYSLLDGTRLHPSFVAMRRRSSDVGDFGAVKKIYGGRCVCCGSKEGERHLKNRHMVTHLERGHCDPRLPLSSANCVPMCSLCNMVYKNHAVFNRRGFIVRWLGPVLNDRVGDGGPQAAAASAKPASRGAPAKSKIAFRVVAATKSKVATATSKPKDAPKARAGAAKTATAAKARTRGGAARTAKTATAARARTRGGAARTAKTATAAKARAGAAKTATAAKARAGAARTATAARAGAAKTATAAKARTRAGAARTAKTGTAAKARTRAGAAKTPTTATAANAMTVVGMKAPTAPNATRVVTRSARISMPSAVRVRRLPPSCRRTLNFGL
jgi:hypothetical protein